MKSQHSNSCCCFPANGPYFEKKQQLYIKLCMCVCRADKKCQVLEKHHYTLLHLFSIKKYFSSYLASTKTERPVWGMSCWPALRSFDDLYILHIFITQNITLQQLYDYLIKSLDTKVLIMR
jgi:hypothetical protein